MTNEFLSFAAGPGESVESQSDYQAAAYRTAGFQYGVLPHQRLNKALRQSSNMSAAVADAVSTLTGRDMLDNGDVSALSLSIRMMFQVTAPGSGGATRTLQNKTTQDLPASILDYGGATGLDATASLQNAWAARSQAAFPSGAWPIASAPTFTGSKFVVAAPDATFSGVGAGALGLATTGGWQSVHQGATGSNFASWYLRRESNYAGGTPEFVCSGMRVDSFVRNAASTSYEWAFTAVMDTLASGGQNVALQGTTWARGTGPAWAQSLLLRDYNVNPTTGKVVLEPTIEGNGGDTNNARIIVDAAARRPSLAGADGEFFAVFRAQAGGDEAHVTFKHLLTTSVGLRLSEGITLHAATITGAAIKLAQDQVIAFNTAATRQLTHNGGGYIFKTNAAAQWELSDSGALVVNGVQLLGARNVGWTAGTGTLTSAKGPFNADTATLLETARRVAAIDNLLINHGLAGA